MKPIKAGTRVAALSGGMMLVAAVTLLPLRAGATPVEGGGTPSTDCWVTFDSMPTANFPAARPTSIRCANRDTVCGDASTAVGYCQYSVNLILNSDQFMPKCVPADLSGNQLLIPYTEADNDDYPKHIDDLQPLQDFIDMKLSTVTADQVDIASGLKAVTVPLSISFTAKGPVFKTTTLTIHTTMCTVPIHGETLCPTPPMDIDNFKLTCTPPIDPMTGKPMTACTGKDGNPISSTFQQIQEHILDRKCSNLSACHGGMKQAGLCLANDCGSGSGHESYDDLVNVVPSTSRYPQAAADGLKRVDPSNAINSLLVHKINGGAQLNSSNPMLTAAQKLGAYGSRMPYPYPHTNLPSGPIGRPKLSRAEIQLITDWIKGGAPDATPGNFITTTALGACH